MWYAGLYTGSTGFLKLCGLLLFLWFARTMSVVDYAAFGLLYAAQTAIRAFSLAGVVEATVGFLHQHRSGPQREELFSAATRVFILNALIVGVVAILALTPFASRAGIQLSTVAWALVGGGLLATSTLQARLIRLEEEHLKSLLFSFLAPFAGVVGGFVAFTIRRDVEAYFLGLSIGVVVGIVPLWRVRRGFRWGLRTASLTRGVFSASVPFMALAFFAWVTGYGNNYVVSALFEPVEVARFTFGMTMSSILGLTASGLNQVWSPRFYQITREQPVERVERKNRRFFGVQAVALGVIGGVIVAVFPSTMRALGGNLLEYQSMNLELALMLAPWILEGPIRHCENYFMAYGRGRELMRVSVVSGLIGLATWAVLMIDLGPIGIYVGFALQKAVRLTGLIIMTRRQWEITVPWGGVAVGLGLIVVGFQMSGVW